MSVADRIEHDKELACSLICGGLDARINYQATICCRQHLKAKTCKEPIVENRKHHVETLVGVAWFLT